jgi:hypothetical protein
MQAGEQALWVLRLLWSMCNAFCWLTVVLCCGVLRCAVVSLHRLSCVQMYASPGGAKPPAQPAAADPQQLTAHDLGLDKQLPWNDK